MRRPVGGRGCRRQSCRRQSPMHRLRDRGCVSEAKKHKALKKRWAGYPALFMRAVFGLPTQLRTIRIRLRLLCRSCDRHARGSAVRWDGVAESGPWMVRGPTKGRIAVRRVGATPSRRTARRTESGNSGQVQSRWIPAFAGMTSKSLPTDVGGGATSSRRTARRTESGNKERASATSLDPRPLILSPSKDAGMTSKSCDGASAKSLDPRPLMSPSKDAGMTSKSCDGASAKSLDPRLLMSPSKDAGMTGKS